jgi:hypothetical protein
MKLKYKRLQLNGFRTSKLIEKFRLCWLPWQNLGRRVVLYSVQGVGGSEQFVCNL